MDAEEIYWMRKKRHDISMKNTNKLGRYGKNNTIKYKYEEVFVKKKRHVPRIHGGLLNVEPERIEYLDEKVTRCLETTWKWVYRKTRSNIGELVHMKTKCFDDLKDNVTAYCVASCAEWYVILDPASNHECFLWNCASHQKIQLPRLHLKFKKCFKCILTAPPTERHSEVVFFNRNHPAILCGGFKSKKWTSITHYVGYSYSQAISCNKKIYAIKSSGKVLYELKSQHGAYPVLHASMEDETAVCPEKQHLVESCGEVFLVQRFSISRLEIYRMDFPNDKWERIYSLGDRVFVLGCYHSVSLDARELGIEGNCIYFFMEDSDRLYVFNLSDQTLSVSQHFSNSGALLLLREGEVPVLRVANNSCNELREAKDKVVNDINGEGESSSTLFNLLPLDVVGKIGRSLGVGRDYMNFRLVCRSWSLAAPPYCWRHDLTSSAMTCPWLLSFNCKEKGTCDFYDPGGYVTYHKKAPPGLPVNIVIHFSKEGWLLCSEGEKSWFLFEQFTQKRINLPNPPPCVNVYLCGMCISGSPGSSDFVVAGIAQVDPKTSHIFLLRSSSKYWLGYEMAFIPSRTSPVYLDGNFYFLGQDGSLGQLSVEEHDETTWMVFDQKLQFPSTVFRSYLVSFDKDYIFSVFVGELGEWVHVYYMTMSGEWVKLEDLENFTLFISQTTSLVVRAEGSLADMKNRIYFPVFSKTDDMKSVFYSMETCRFETKEGCDFVRGSLCDTEELLNCSWFCHRMVSTH